MTSTTTTATALELSALLYPSPALPRARPTRAAKVGAVLGAAALVLWLAATLAVLIGHWRPPVPAVISGGHGATASPCCPAVYGEPRRESSATASSRAM